MKLLCLHGYGMSSEILEEMSSSLIAALGSHHEYVFVDGEVTVNRSAMAEFIPGRHLSYWDAWGAASLRAAYELMDETIEAKGPFDGAFAYSQGGAFALGYMLQRLIDNPSFQIPFKFVVFCGTAAALSADPEYKTQEITAALDKLSDKEKDELHEGFVSRNGHKDPREFDIVKKGKVNGYDRDLFIALLDMVQASLGARNFFGILESDETAASDPDSYGLAFFPRFFHPIYTEQRIPIPTIHLRGKFDDPSPLALSEIGKNLCEPSLMTEIRYNGVHEVPREKGDIDRIVKAIDEAYIKGEVIQQINARL